MSTILLKGANVVNVFLDSLEKKNVLIKDDRIVGVGDYDTADEVIDVTGKYICPGFIDGHIHIESSMLTPRQFVKAAVPCGTSVIVADPHEIANVCGTHGISYMLESSHGMPMRTLIALPSCVPATPLDESGAILNAEELEPFYRRKRVISLGEVMNYPGVVAGDESVINKLKSAKENKRVINGHAPLLKGKDLDAYIAAGITDDHECSNFEEAKEKIAKGQWIMIRQGTSARNLDALIDLFDEPYAHRCMLVTDDKHPADLMNSGHLDATIRRAVKLGKSVFTGIRMATLQPANYYGLADMGAVAPGYIANLLVLDDLEEVKVSDVYYEGKLVCKNKELLPFEGPKVDRNLERLVSNTFYINKLSKEDFLMEKEERYNHVMEILPGELLTTDYTTQIDFSKNNGIDTQKDIIKIAVCERHYNTGHIGLGFVKGLGLKKGAIASSVSHDSHNLIVAGTSEEEMAFVANTCIEMGGGLAVCSEGKVLAKLPLPIGGLMSNEEAAVVAKQNEEVRKAVHTLGAPDDIEPFMNLAFVSLPVIPHLKLTTRGLVNVDTQTLL